jgi:outer membrane protein assembly factor BamE
MGNPLLTDTFHADRWDYLYSLQPGGGERQQERMSVIFNSNDQLVSLSGDFMPGVSRDEAILGKDSGTSVTAPATENAEKPKPEQPAKPGSLLDQIQKDVDGVETVPVPTPEPLDTSPQ